MATVQSGDAPPEKAGRWQFSLRTALLLIAGFAVVLGTARMLWIAYFKPYYEEARIARGIERLGGWVVWDGMTVIEAHARHNYGDGVSWSDYDLKCAVPHLKQLPNLRCLDLEITQITDSGLRHLRGINHLAELNLTLTGVTDAGLVHLRHMKQLETLSVTGSFGIRGSGIRNVTDLPRLRVLELRATPVGDSVLPHIAQLSTLVTLDLGRTEVSDEGVRHLVVLTWLEQLSLDNTHVTDACLEHLARLPNLRQLDLHFTDVTEKGAQNLTRVLPGLKIDGLDIKRD